MILKSHSGDTTTYLHFLSYYQYIFQKWKKHRTNSLNISYIFIESIYQLFCVHKISSKFLYYSNIYLEKIHSIFSNFGTKLVYVFGTSISCKILYTLSHDFWNTSIRCIPRIHVPYESYMKVFPPIIQKQFIIVMIE